MDPKIVSCRIQPSPAYAGLPGPQQVLVRFATDAEEEQLFEYFPDEITFTATELLGKTRGEALELLGQRDREYLRS